MSLVSVIIPTFNRRSVLERALNSVLKQTFSDWELIVVDDGSTDETQSFFGEWLKQVESHHPQHHSKICILRTTNGGVSRARNFGVQNSSSPWIAFLDSDDEWLPEKLERQLPLTSSFQLVHGEEIWMRNGVRVNAMKKHAKGGGEIFDRCVELCCISPSTTMLSRTLFTRMNGFREDFPVCEDYELWLRITSEMPVGFVSEPVQIKYGGNPDQLSLSFPAMDFYRVKALLPFVARENVARNILKRCDILLKGYVKYPNPSHQSLVISWRQVALNALTHIQSTHSAAERLPRSDETLVL